MLAGVNGAGKTTSIGKLAKYLQSQGHSVLLAAGDTFRAAAREQLDRLGRAQQRRRDRAGRRRSGRRHVRRHRRGEGARHRRRARRHRRPPADAAPPDGRDPQGQAACIQKADPARRTRRCSCSTPTPARTRWRRSRRSTRRSGSTGLVLTKLDGTRQGRRRGRHRQAAPDPAAVHRRRRRASTTCGRSSPPSSSTRWSADSRQVSARSTPASLLRMNLR